MFDPTTEQLLRAVDRLGYRVGISTTDTGYQFTAEDRETGEAYIVRGDAPYETASHLATAVGIDLMDG